jgi:hypothetical protein
MTQPRAKAEKIRRNWSEDSRSGDLLSTTRIFVVVIALYAVLLQQFTVSAVPAAACESFGAITCLQDVRVPGAPANDLHCHHGVCCILGCAASIFTAIVTAGVLFVFAALLVSSFVFAKAKDRIVRSPVRFYFAARGPPKASERAVSHSMV